MLDFKIKIKIMALSGRFARPDNLLRFFVVDERTGRLKYLTCRRMFGSRKTLREHLRLQHVDVYYSELDPTLEELELKQEVSKQYCVCDIINI